MSPRIILASCVVLFCLLTAPAFGATYDVPMTDGTTLVTDVFFPSTGGPAWPVILERTPYARATKGTTWNDIGMVFVCQSVRGTSGSGGVFQPFADDGWGTKQDGVDTLKWIKAQPWCNGKVGTYGGSATSITSALLSGATTDLGVQIFRDGGSNFSLDLAYHGGVFHKALCEDWLTVVGVPQYVNVWKAEVPTSSYWTYYDAHSRAPLMNAPGLHVSGWWDIFANSTVRFFIERQYRGGEGARGNQKLAMRPTTHGDWNENTTGFHLPANYQDFKVTPYQKRFAQYWLSGVVDPIMSEPPVTYYTVGPDDRTLAGAMEWRTADKWPPFPPRETPFYLSFGDLLSTTPSTTTTQETFVFSPSGPVPTQGGQNLTLIAGPLDQSSVSNRGDVLKFATAAFNYATETTGHFRVQLYVSTDGVDTDFTVKLVDVYPTSPAREVLLLDGVQRVKYRNGLNVPPSPIVPGQIVPITVDLGDISWVFDVGHRIGIQISSSNYRRFEVNPNTGADFPTQSTRAAVNTVHFGGFYPSALYVMLRDPSVDTDDDGTTDEQEWNSAEGDMDNDGVKDSDEYYIYGTNPWLPDRQNPPVISAFQINEGAAKTFSRNVLVKTVCSNAPSELMISESPNFAGATWLPFIPTTSLTLSSGDGIKIVYAKARNSAGESSPVSDTIVLTQKDPPAIVEHPQSIDLELGATTSLTVLASGSLPLTYQWKKNGVVIDFASSAAYTIDNAEEADEGSYTCTVSNEAGTVTSNEAKVTVVNTPPALTLQPLSQTVAPGSPAAFSIMATGTPPLSYQWRKDGADLFSGTDTTYTIPSAQQSREGVYTCLVSNAYGWVESDGASLTVLDPPTLSLLSFNGGTTAGGLEVILTGQNLAFTTQVMFGNVPATQFSVLDDNQLVATTPAHAAGVVDVTVVTSAGTSNGVSFEFTCTTPPAPGAIFATDGTLADSVLIEWSASYGATGYDIYRTAAGSSDVPELIGHTDGLTLTFDDFTALPPTMLAPGTPGCNATVGAVEYHKYNYQVRATNECSQSDLSVAEEGYRGGEAKAAVAKKRQAGGSLADLFVTLTSLAAVFAGGHWVARRPSAR